MCTCRQGGAPKCHLCAQRFPAPPALPVTLPATRLSAHSPGAAGKRGWERVEEIVVDHEDLHRAAAKGDNRGGGDEGARRLGEALPASLCG